LKNIPSKVREYYRRKKQPQRRKKHRKGKAATARKLTPATLHMVKLGDNNLSLVEHPQCRVDGCERMSHARGFCRLHYSEWFLSRAPVCKVPGCTCKSVARDLCATHYQYARRHGGWREKEPQQNAASSNGGCDSRFCGLSLDELELRVLGIWSSDPVDAAFELQNRSKLAGSLITVTGLS
jgi:hypothetical protein